MNGVTFLCIIVVLLVEGLTWATILLLEGIHQLLIISLLTNGCIVNLFS